MTEEEEVKTPIIVQKKRKRVDGEVDEEEEEKNLLASVDAVHAVRGKRQREHLRRILRVRLWI